VHARSWLPPRKRWTPRGNSAKRARRSSTRRPHRIRCAWPAQNYDACLKGPFASDLEIRLGAARSYFACERFNEAITHLEFIRRTNPDFRADQVSLLLAQALGGAGRKSEARTEFEAAVARFGSFESRAEYAIWAATSGDAPTAARLYIELERAMERWNRHTRELNRPLLRRLTAAVEASRRGT
jgi:hypothetical protein